MVFEKGFRDHFEDPGVLLTDFGSGAPTFVGVFDSCSAHPEIWGKKTKGCCLGCLVGETLELFLESSFDDVLKRRRLGSVHSRLLEVTLLALIV